MMYMNRKNYIRIVCSIVVTISVFIMTCFFGMLLIKTTLGSTSYAVSIPLLLPLALIPTFISSRIFSVTSNEEIEYEEENAETEYEETEESDSIVLPQLDESAYPELFQNKQTQEAALKTSRPDIKALLHEQSGEFEAEIIKEEKEELPDDFLLNLKEPEKKCSLYEELPTELPEDYVPYEYDSEEENVEDYEEEYTITPLHRVVAKIILTLVSAALAIILPINCATVYSTSSVTVRRPFSKTEYVFENADYYTVGVKLTGDISMKLHFSDGTEKELIYPDYAVTSEGFKNSFSSKYAYAAFCNRLLKRSGVEKKIGDLVSLTPSAGLSQKDIAYIEEITEVDLTN